jgi:hypothetical protein
LIGGKKKATPKADQAFAEADTFQDGFTQLPGSEEKAVGGGEEGG